jgi:hypothetical protein
LLKGDEVNSVNWNISDEISGGYGSPRADCSLNKIKFSENDDLILNIRLEIRSKEIRKYFEDLKGIGAIISAERIYDKNGHPNLMNNNCMSTVLAPTGMPIEFFISTTVNYFKLEKPYRSILELSDFKTKEQIRLLKDGVQLEYVLNKKIPPNFPEGYYRLHLDFHIDSKEGKERLSLLYKLWPEVKKGPKLFIIKRPDLFKKHILCLFLLSVIQRHPV